MTTARKPRLAAISSEIPTMQPTPLPKQPTNADLARGQEELHGCLEGARKDIGELKEGLGDVTRNQSEMATQMVELSGHVTKIALRVGAGKPGVIKTGRPGTWVALGAGIATIIGFLAKASPAWPDIQHAALAVLRALGAH
jgi:hypothetical protein